MPKILINKSKNQIYFETPSNLSIHITLGLGIFETYNENWHIYELNVIFLI